MIKHLEIKGSSAYYEAAALSDVTEESLRSCFSLTNCSKLLFNLPGSDACEYDTIKKNIPDSYAVRIHYHASGERFLLPPRPAAEFGVAAMTCETDFIRGLYLQKIMELYEKWKQYVTPDRVAFSRDVAQYKLLPENSLCLAKDSVPVGLVTTYKREGTDSYCLNWIWFDPLLSRPDRACAHYLAVGWLKEKGRSIDAFVDSFNLRSQRFFVKIGFRPVCLHITKNSAR
ncbi:MAG: hypothetical protein A2X32_00640 [Elusimicrobia bacterium GWC2_64_44]|nr:MAG: hypothetical protein A2X32_00640 [Elusimicrobia bacterium GWC2_64_44]